ncbi:hypothetical protein BFT35_03995 [Thermoanaerobacterium thermosaccharolyticum]|nr:hypothetical protein BFT35_03995 [Thermoanaerobacterium thermosaccharolyticum]
MPLSLMLSVYFYNIYKKNKQNKILVFAVILVALIYQLLMGTRSGAVDMILALLGVEIIREGKLKFKSFIKLGIPLIFVITFIAYFVGKSGVDKTKPFLQNIGAFYKDIITYLFGGMAAFDKAVMYHGLISSNGGVKRFFLQTAKSFGFNVYVPSLHMQFTSIGPGLVTNVYTIYSYYYIDYGLLGTCFFVFLLGIISSFIYKKAKSGNDLYCVLYGFFVSGIILSVYNENFYTNLNFLIKVIIIISILEFLKRLRLSRYNTSCQYGGDGNFENSGIYRGN